MLPDNIMQTLRQSIGLEENDTSRDEAIRAMNLRSMIDSYLKWEGVIGYTNPIMTMIQSKKS